MPVTFPTAGSDACLHTAADIAAPSAFTIGCWYRGVRVAGEFCNFFNLGTAPNIDIYFNSSADEIRMDVDFSGTNGGFRLTAANYGVTPSTSAWNFLAIAYDGASTANVPTWYHANYASGGPVARTNTAGTTPTGSRVTGGSHVLHIGNFNAHDAGFGGDIGWAFFHNAVLTEGELYSAFWNGYALVSALYGSELYAVGSEYDWTGNARTLTANGSPTSLTTTAPTVWPGWRQSAQGTWLPLAEEDEEPPASNPNRLALLGVG